MPKKILCPLIGVMLIALLNGCAPYHAEKALCDQFGSGCGSKVKINQW